MVLILLLIAVSTSLLGSQSNNNISISPEKKLNIRNLPLEIRLKIAEEAPINTRWLLLTHDEKNDRFYYKEIFGQTLEKITKKIAIQWLGKEIYEHTPFNIEECKNLKGCSSDFINTLNFFYNSFLEKCEQLESYCHPNLLKGDKSTTLWKLCATKKVSRYIVKLLIRHGADVNKIIDGKSALYNAIQNHKQGTVQELIKAKVDTNKLVFNKPPLYYAIIKEQPLIATELIIGGAKVDVDWITKNIPLTFDELSKEMELFLKANELINGEQLEKRRGNRNSIACFVGGTFLGSILALGGAALISNSNR